MQHCTKDASAWCFSNGPAAHDVPPRSHADAEYPSAGDQCGACKGKCLISEKKTFEVHIEPGMKQGARIVLRGEAGCSEPGLAPGDVVLVVQQKEHETFKRVNVDLVVERKISLMEALCGATLHIKHLDGRVLKIQTPPGACVCWGGAGCRCVSEYLWSSAGVWP